MTCSQSKSCIWFQNVPEESQPLHNHLFQQSNPVMHQFMPKACQYGCEHEEQARVKYFDDQSKIHSSLIVINCVLILHPLYPFSLTAHAAQLEY